MQLITSNIPLPKITVVRQGFSKEEAGFITIKQFSHVKNSSVTRVLIGSTSKSYRILLTLRDPTKQYCFVHHYGSACVSLNGYGV